MAGRRSSDSFADENVAPPPTFNKGHGGRPSSRIPQTLQAVFLASNRGKDVHKPPPDRVAFKVFLRNWVFHKKVGNRTLNSSSKDSTTGKSDSDPSLLNEGKWKQHELTKGMLFHHLHGSANVKNDIVPEKENDAGSSSLDQHPEFVPPLASKPPSPASSPESPTLSPQDYLDAMIRSRGYSTQRFATLQTAYYNKPTTLQMASYHVFLMNLVRQKNAEKFRSILQAGISPNPCNVHGESLVHMICRRGDAALLQIMVELGCCLQVADDYGRTPLHDAFWAASPCFEVVEIILREDRRMLHLMDSHGAVPLTYVRKDHWPQWLEFLASKNNEYWPARNVKVHGEEEPPELTMWPPNSRPIPEPKSGLTPEMAAMVASGKMEPCEAEFLRYDKEQHDDSFNSSNNDCCCSSSEEPLSDDDDDSDCESEYDSNYDDSHDDSSEFDEEEMEEILNSLTLRKTVSAH